MRNEGKIVHDAVIGDVQGIGNVRFRLEQARTDTNLYRISPTAHGDDLLMITGTAQLQLRVHQPERQRESV